MGKETTNLIGTQRGRRTLGEWKRKDLIYYLRTVKKKEKGKS